MAARASLYFFLLIKNFGLSGRKKDPTIDITPKIQAMTSSHIQFLEIFQK
jgi:hypothetical protein